MKEKEKLKLEIFKVKKVCLVFKVRCAGAKTASFLPKKHQLLNTAPKKALQTLKK